MEGEGGGQSEGVVLPHTEAGSSESVQSCPFTIILFLKTPTSFVQPTQEIVL